MQKLPLRERRYKALLGQIARLTRKRNEAIKMIVKAETLLPKLERQQRRYEFPTARAKAEHKPKLELDIPVGPIPPVVVDNVRAGLGIKSKRKPKAADVTDIPVSEFPIPDDYAAKMEDMGFRKVGKRKGNALSSE